MKQSVKSLQAEVKGLRAELTLASQRLGAAIDARYEVERTYSKQRDDAEAKLKAPIEMILFCPLCHERHYDDGEFKTKPHHTHACQHCGFVWRPAIQPTVGVRFLEGFKNP